MFGCITLAVEGIMEARIKQGDAVLTLNGSVGRVLSIDPARNSAYVEFPPDDPIGTPRLSIPLNLLKCTLAEEGIYE